MDEFKVHDLDVYLNKHPMIFEAITNIDLQTNMGTADGIAVFDPFQRTLRNHREFANPELDRMMFLRSGVFMSMN